MKGPFLIDQGRTGHLELFQVAMDDELSRLKDDKTLHLLWEVLALFGPEGPEKDRERHLK